MTIHWTKAQAAKYFDQSTPTPQPPTPRHKALRERVEVGDYQWGKLGRTSHLWALGRKPDWMKEMPSKYISRCGKFSTSRKPDGKRGKRECALCAKAMEG